MIGFEPTAKQQELFDRTRTFITDRIIPFEKDIRWGPHGPSDELRLELNELARAAGLFAPHVSPEFGGLGLDHVSQALVFEAAGYSPLGPTALHCMAPDEGNMAMLEKIATPEQKERWLRPLANGTQRSIFCMTEPGGAGADPGLLHTTAEPDGDDWIINGRKWFITGANGAGIGIVMADVPAGKSDTPGATMFLFQPSDPAFEIVRVMDTMDRSFTGGHAEVAFNNLRVGPDNVLGGVGEGFRYAQARLSPARLTHCMRWLGAARRCHDIACYYAAKRSAFGQKLHEHGSIGAMLADNEIDLHQARLTIWHTAWCLDQGNKARHESSMAKVAVSEALYRVADRAVQILGGTGVSDDTVVAGIFQDIRAFRIYDGPSEVHRWAIARRIMKPFSEPDNTGND